MNLNKDAIGSSFDDSLEEENILAESDATAIKRVIAFEVENPCKRNILRKQRWQKEWERVEVLLLDY